MTNYNDGNWIGWNGGECPVHPKTVVEVVFWDGEETGTGIQQAEFFDWDSVDCPIIAFRVVEEHREPREWWVWLDMEGLPHFGSSHIPGSFKVLEVLE